MRRLSLTLVLAVGLLAVPAMPAAAAVTCTFSAGTVTVTMSSAGDFVSIRRQAGGNIELTTTGPTTVTCAGGTPTVNTTDLVQVNDTSAGNTAVIISLGSGRFAPGATDEAGTSDEIEFDLTFGAGVTDQLVFNGSDMARDRWTFGVAGINLNAGESGGVDADVTYSGLESTDQLTGGGNDVIDGGGGTGTGAPFGIGMQVQSGDGNDVVTGGAANDSIRPEGFAPTNSNDIVNGRGGRDVIDYFFAPSGVRVNLSAQTATGPAIGSDRVRSVENVIGSDSGNDVLIGSSVPNELVGHAGSDRIRPVGAGSGVVTDFVSGGGGPDTVDYSNEGSPVVVDLTSTASGCPQTATGPSIDVDCLDEIERAIGSRRGDQLLGDAEPNVLRGGLGEDELRGRDEGDTLRGSAGDDKLFGEAGEDALDGGDDRDRCVGGPDPDTFTRCERRVQ